MQWGSLAEFFAMGGYGLYVWASFGATALCMSGEVLAVWRRSAAAAGSRDDRMRDQPSVGSPNGTDR